MVLYLKRVRAISKAIGFYEWLQTYNFHGKDDQLSRICNNDGEIIVKRIARYENLESDCRKIFQEFNICINPFVRRHNATRSIEAKLNWRDSYDEESIKLVYTRYKQEIDLFGYRFQ